MPYIYHFNVVTVLNCQKLKKESEKKGQNDFLTESESTLCRMSWQQWLIIIPDCDVNHIC